MVKVTAYTICFLSTFLGTFLLNTSFLRAEDIFGTFQTEVSAYIDINPYSTVEIDNENTEVGLWRDIRVRITDANGDPLVDRNIIFYSDIVESSYFVQPLPTDSDGYAYGKVSFDTPGVYIIKGKDITYPNEIFINGTATAYVFPVPTPTLSSIPYYTQGLTNAIGWSEVEGMDSSYEYFLEVSTSSSFSDTVITSGWITETEFSLINLTDSQMYFYRVRARNSQAGMSSWSQSIFSVQDNTSPNISPISKPTLLKKANGANITFKFTVSDSLSLKSVELLCKKDSDTYRCGSLESVGSNYTATVDIEELDRRLLQNLEGTYSFCIKAKDQAGNETQDCSFEIKLEEQVDVDIPIYTEIVSYIFKGVGSIVSDINYVSNQFLSNFRSIILTFIGFLLLLISSLLSFTILFGSISTFPITLGLLITNIYRFFGLIKHGSPAGVVYDSNSERPVSLCIVEIYDGKNRLLGRRYTNSNGEFFGDFGTGKYRVVVKRSGYIFPSISTGGSGERTVYGGAVFNIQKGSKMNVSIPIDIIGKGENALSSMLIKSLNLIVTLFGLLVAFSAMQRDVSVYNIILLFLYIPVIAIYIHSILKREFSV